MRKLYTIKFREEREQYVNYKTEEKEIIPGNDNHTSLQLESIQDAMNIISIAKLRYWEIFETRDEESDYVDWKREPTVQAPELLKWKDDQEADREEFHRLQALKAEAINMLPKTFKLNTGYKEFDNHYVIKRSDYEYRKGYSKALQGGFNIEHRKGNYFSISSFKTRGGTWQLKKFIDSFYYNAEAKPDNKEAKVILTCLEIEYNKVKNLIQNTRDAV